MDATSQVADEGEVVMKYMNLEQRLIASRTDNSECNELFVNEVMSKIANSEILSDQIRKMSVNKKETFVMKLKHMPKFIAILIAIGVLLGLSGTSYALYITFFPKPTTTHTITTSLPNGNHIIGINTTSCMLSTDLDGSEPKLSSEIAYYEVSREAKITNQQLTEAVQGICEENIINNRTSMIIHQLPANILGLFSAGPFIIKSISQNSITVVTDPHTIPANQTDIMERTFTNFADNIITYDQNTKITFDDFKVGDTVKFVSQTIDSESTEMINPNNPDYNPENDTENIRVLAILKVPALTSNANQFYKSLGTDFVKTQPCTTDPSGFCRTYDFN